jgi:hypothetical protein
VSETTTKEAGPVQRLREIADQDIGGNNPNLADRINDIATWLEADMRGPDEPLPALALVRSDDLSLFFSKLGGRQFLRAGSDAGAAESRLREAAQEPSECPAEPPLPDGEFGHVELPGFVQHTGWVTEGTRAGCPVLVIRDWDGRKIAEVVPQAMRQFIALPTPLKRPEPQAALPAGAGFGYESDDEYDEANPF